MIIGMFHTRKDPKKVTRAYLYAAIAKMEGFDFFYFTARNVDFDNETIYGKQYRRGKWRNKAFPFPDVIMNVAYPRSEFQNNVYNRLKSKIPFTSSPVGNKLQVYDTIQAGQQFAEYLIPYQELSNPDELLDFLDSHQKVIVKPLVGHHGELVVYVEKIYNYYQVKDGDQTHTLYVNDLLDYMKAHLEKRPMLMQKFIPCMRKTGEKYDIRLLLSKKGNGKWHVDIFVKIGSKDKITTNVTQGGQVTIISNFLMNEFKDSHFDVQRYLETFALQFAKHFESLYRHNFDELGVDIGLDDQMKIWIYEVNWHPGQVFVESKSAKNAVLYANYVAENAPKE